MCRHLWILHFIMQQCKKRVYRKLYCQTAFDSFLTRIKQTGHMGLLCVIIMMCCLKGDLKFKSDLKAPSFDLRGEGLISHESKKKT